MLMFEFAQSETVQNLAGFDVDINATEYLRYFLSAPDDTGVPRSILRTLFDTEHYNIRLAIFRYACRFTRIFSNCIRGTGDLGPQFLFFSLKVVNFD